MFEKFSTFLPSSYVKTENLQNKQRLNESPRTPLRFARGFSSFTSLCSDASPKASSSVSTRGFKLSKVITILFGVCVFRSVFINSSYMRKLLPTLLILGLMLFKSGSVQAEDKLSIGVFPPIIEISANTPAVIETQIKLTNNNESSQDIKIILKPFKASSTNNGQLEYLPDDAPAGPDPLLFEKIEIFEGNNPIRKIHLNPVEEKTITMKITLDETSQNGDYYFSLIFMSEGEAPDDGTGSKITSGIATNVLMTIGSPITAKGTIKAFTTSFFKEKGPVALTLLIENQSGNYIKPTGEITITNMFGQVVGRLELLPQNILAGSSRYFKDTHQVESSDQLDRLLPQMKLENDSVIWPETFILGLYTAKASVRLADGGPSIIKSTTFVSLPILWVGVFSLAALVVIGVALRVTKKI